MKNNHYIKTFENFENNDKISYDEMIKTLETNYKKEFNKYYRTMSYRIMAVEVEALYNVLVLKHGSDDEFMKRYENKVREILARK